MPLIVTPQQAPSVVCARGQAEAAASHFQIEHVVDEDIGACAKLLAGSEALDQGAGDGAQGEIRCDEGRTPHRSWCSQGSWTVGLFAVRFAGGSCRPRRPRADDGYAVRRRQNGASGRGLPKLAPWIVELWQLQAVHCAVELQIRRWRCLVQRLVQDLGKGLTSETIKKGRARKRALPFLRPQRRLQALSRWSSRARASSGRPSTARSFPSVAMVCGSISATEPAIYSTTSIAF